MLLMDNKHIEIVKGLMKHRFQIYLSKGETIAAQNLIKLSEEMDFHDLANSFRKKLQEKEAQNNGWNPKLGFSN